MSTKEAAEVYCDGRCDEMGCRGHAVDEFRAQRQGIDADYLLESLFRERDRLLARAENAAVSFQECSDKLKTAERAHMQVLRERDRAIDQREEWKARAESVERRHAEFVEAERKSWFAVCAALGLKQPTENTAELVAHIAKLRAESDAHDESHAPLPVELGRIPAGPGHGGGGVLVIETPPFRNAK